MPNHLVANVPYFDITLCRLARVFWVICQPDGQLAISAWLSLIIKISKIRSTPFFIESWHHAHKISTKYDFPLFCYSRSQNCLAKAAKLPAECLFWHTFFTVESNPNGWTISKASIRVRKAHPKSLKQKTLAFEMKKKLKIQRPRQLVRNLIFFYLLR